MKKDRQKIVREALRAFVELYRETEVNFTVCEFRDMFYPGQVIDGYLESKYERWRDNPLLFLCSLSEATTEGLVRYLSGRTPT